MLAEIINSFIPYPVFITISLRPVLIFLVAIQENAFSMMWYAKVLYKVHRRSQIKECPFIFTYTPAFQRFLPMIFTFQPSIPATG
jgi:hypothetical protein